MVDRDLLKEVSSANIELVLDALGIHYLKKGRRYWVICPFHNDKKIGSAYLTDTGYFVCHSCDTKVDLFDFIMQVNGCGFKEASGFLCGLFGGSERFGANDKMTTAAVNYRKLRLTPAEITALNIPSDINLKALYFYDARKYKALLKARANHMLMEYQNLLATVARRDAINAILLYELCGSSSHYNKFGAEIKARIICIQGIIERLA